MRWLERQVLTMRPDRVNPPGFSFQTDLKVGWGPSHAVAAFRYCRRRSSGWPKRTRECWRQCPLRGGFRRKTAGGLYQNSRQLARQKIAVGLIGEPVPPGTASGASVNRNTQRCCSAATWATRSRSMLSIIGMPIAFSNSR
jgi:hypothetical protein